MRVEFDGIVWFWRGPAPYYFVTVPEAESEQLAEVSDAVSYGWGMVPATVIVGETTWTTALWPKNGGYIVPLKDAVRRAEQIELDDDIHLIIEIAL
jgi:hypothetical protein